MIKKNQIVAFLFAFLAIYYLIANFSIYKSFIVVATMVAMLAIGYLSLSKNIRLKNPELSIIFFAAWAFTYLWSFLANGESIGFGYIVILLYSVMFLNLRNDFQITIAKYFIWGLSLLCFCSLVEYAVFLTTSRGIVLQEITRTTIIQNTYFYQLIFNIIRIGDITLRFQGLADEPGQMGTLCGMLLFLMRRMEMKKFPFFVILVSGLLSFSLAFYILLIIILLTSAEISFKRSILMILVAAVVIWFVQDQFNEKIVERISDTENIDNRTGEVFDAYFNVAVTSGQIWTGIGGEQVANIAEYSGSGQAGVKVFILQYGAICTLLIFLTYNYLYIAKSRGKLERYDWLFLLAFWLSFYQRQNIYLPFTIIIFFTIPIAKSYLNYHTSKSNEKA